jgi:hypothetical protein
MDTVALDGWHFCLKAKVPNNQSIFQVLLSDFFNDFPKTNNQGSGHVFNGEISGSSYYCSHCV